MKPFLVIMGNDDYGWEVDFYCTQKPPYLYMLRDSCYRRFVLEGHDDFRNRECSPMPCNGSVVGSAIISDVILIHVFENDGFIGAYRISGNDGKTKTSSSDAIVQISGRSMLTPRQLLRYQNGKKGIYGLKLTNAEPFLTEDEKDIDYRTVESYGLKLPPQSWCYSKDHKKIVMSIGSEWLYHILNHEKDLEIRSSIPSVLGASSFF